MLKINELKEHQSLETYMLVSQVKDGVTVAKAPYVSVVFQDNTGSIEGKLWDIKPAQREVLKLGSVVFVKAEVIKYRNALQLRIVDVKEADSSMYNLEDFVTTGLIARSDLEKEVAEAVDSITNENLQLLVRTLLIENEEQFFKHAAAVKNHHEFVSGLATHVVGMLRIANSICDLYPMLNRDLLVAGILVHDMGKMVELTDGIVPEYTMEGKLLGHISIMQAKVAKVAEELQINDENVLLLRHMILSHHGEYEFGSPVLPMIPEAEVLHMIDNLDARMEMLRKAMDSVQEGEFTARIFSLENRMFYKAKR